MTTQEKIINDLTTRLSSVFHRHDRGDIFGLHPEGCPTWTFGFLVKPNGNISIMPAVIAEFGEQEDWNIFRTLLIEWLYDDSIEVRFFSEGLKD